MTDASVDFESYSECDLKAAGADAYARHPSTDLLCMAWAIGDMEPELWTPGEPREDWTGRKCEACKGHGQRYSSVHDSDATCTWCGGTGDEHGTVHNPFPPALAAHIAAGGKLTAWNAAFEETLWRNVAVPKYGFPFCRGSTWWCTAAAGANMGLPRDLDGAAAALGGGAAQKDLTGKRVMMQLSRPRVGGGRWTPEAAPDKFETLYEYCRQDIRAERGILARVYALTPTERATYLLDAKINGRGIRIDRSMIEAAQRLVDAELARLDAQMSYVTGGAVTACSQAARLCKWLGVESVAAHVVDEMLATARRESCVQEALLLRQEAAKSSNAKLAAMLAAAGPDDRIRGALLYYGAARTGRWAGRLLQPQNLPRGNLSGPDVILATKLIKAENAGALRLLFSSPLDAISSCLRGCIIPAEGHELMACDFSAIEARALAWLAGQNNVLEIFRGHGKIYEHQAAAIYGVPMEAVTKAQRQIGKVAVLALGYQGWVGAFVTMAKTYGLVISDEEAAKIAGAYRDSNPKIKAFWYACNDAAFKAVASPGTKQKVRGVTYLAANDYLWARLPSGRVLAYCRPSIKKNDRGEDAVHFWGQNSVTRKWEEQSAYGGLLVENITQAVARDLMAEAMFRLEAAGYPVVLSVHDEAVCEVKKGFGSVEEMESIMAVVPAWAAGMPIAAEGFRSDRYRKG